MHYLGACHARRHHRLTVLTSHLAAYLCAVSTPLPSPRRGVDEHEDERAARHAHWDLPRHDVRDSSEGEELGGLVRPVTKDPDPNAGHQRRPPRSRPRYGCVQSEKKKGPHRHLTLACCLRVCLWLSGLGYPKLETYGYKVERAKMIPGVERATPEDYKKSKLAQNKTPGG